MKIKVPEEKSVKKTYWIVFFQDAEKDYFHPVPHIFASNPNADLKGLATYIGIQEIEMEFVGNDTE